MKKGKMTEEEKLAWWAANKAKAEAKRKEAERRQKEFVEWDKKRRAEFNKELIRWHSVEYHNG